MALDHFSVSVTQNVVTNLAAGRIWEQGARIKRIGVFAPVAATSFTYTLFMGAQVIIEGFTPRKSRATEEGFDTLPRKSPSASSNGTSWSGDYNILTPVGFENVVGEKNIISALHSGAAAQSIEVAIDFEPLTQ